MKSFDAKFDFNKVLRRQPREVRRAAYRYYFWQMLRLWTWWLGYIGISFVFNLSQQLASRVWRNGVLWESLAPIVCTIIYFQVWQHFFVDPQMRRKMHDYLREYKIAGADLH